VALMVGYGDSKGEMEPGRDRLDAHVRGTLDNGVTLEVECDERPNGAQGKKSDTGCDRWVGYETTQPRRCRAMHDTRHDAAPSMQRGRAMHVHR
jgi:hypothetical protein